MTLSALLVLLSLWSLAPAVVVVPTVGPDRCPSSHQLSLALAAKLGAGADAAAPAPPAETLRLFISSSPPSSAEAPPSIEVELLDPAGQSRLRRTLASSADAGPTACAALAETIALIVDRYLHELDSQSRSASVPPSTPPPAPATPPPDQRLTDVAVVLGVSWRGDPDALQGFETLIGVDLQRAAHERGAGATVMVGISPAVGAPVMGGHATLRRIPLRVGTYVSLLAGPGRLEPGLNLGIDALLVEVVRSGSTQVIRKVSPNVEAVMGYRLRGGVYFARAALAAGLAVPGHLLDEPDPDPVLSTPRTYIRIALETGFYFH